MQDTIFLRGASKDNKEAKKVLQDHNVVFVEVYAEFKSHPPILYTEESVYAYKGLTQIKEYASAYSSIRANGNAIVTQEK